MGTLCCHLMDTRALDQDNPSQRLQKAGAECPPLNTCLVNSYLGFTCLGNPSQRKQGREWLREAAFGGAVSKEPACWPKSRSAGPGVYFVGSRRSQICPRSLLWVSSLSSHPPCRGQVRTVGQGPAAQRCLTLQETPTSLQ